MYRGILIPVITPFHEDSSVDEDTLRQLVDFYFRAKVHGLFALGSSGQLSSPSSTPSPSAALPSPSNTPMTSAPRRLA